MSSHNFKCSLLLLLCLCMGTTANFCPGSSNNDCSTVQYCTTPDEGTTTCTLPPGPTAGSFQLMAKYTAPLGTEIDPAGFYVPGEPLQLTLTGATITGFQLFCTHTNSEFNSTNTNKPLVGAFSDLPTGVTVVPCCGGDQFIRSGTTWSSNTLVSVTWTAPTSAELASISGTTRLRCTGVIRSDQSSNVFTAQLELPPVPTPTNCVRMGEYYCLPATGGAASCVVSCKDCLGKMFPANVDASDESAADGSSIIFGGTQGSTTSRIGGRYIKPTTQPLPTAAACIEPTDLDCMDMSAVEGSHYFMCHATTDSDTDYNKCVETCGDCGDAGTSVTAFILPSLSSTITDTPYPTSSPHSDNTIADNWWPFRLCVEASPESCTSWELSRPDTVFRYPSEIAHGTTLLTNGEDGIELWNRVTNGIISTQRWCLSYQRGPCDTRVTPLGPTMSLVDVSTTTYGVAAFGGSISECFMSFCPSKQSCVVSGAAGTLNTTNTASFASSLCLACNGVGTHYQELQHQNVGGENMFDLFDSLQRRVCTRIYSTDACNSQLLGNENDTPEYYFCETGHCVVSGMCGHPRTTSPIGREMGLVAWYQFSPTTNLRDNVGKHDLTSVATGSTRLLPPITDEGVDLSPPLLWRLDTPPFLPKDTLTITAYVKLLPISFGIRDNIVVGEIDPEGAHGYSSLNIKQTTSGIGLILTDTPGVPLNTELLPYTASTWLHVAVVRTVEYRKLYADGVLVASDDNGAYEGSPNLKVARVGSGVDESTLQGHIGDLKIYSQALTDNRVMLHYNATPKSCASAALIYCREVSLCLPTCDHCDGLPHLVTSDDGKSSSCEAEPHCWWDRLFKPNNIPPTQDCTCPVQSSCVFSSNGALVQLHFDQGESAFLSGSQLFLSELPASVQSFSLKDVDVTGDVLLDVLPIALTTLVITNTNLRGSFGDTSLSTQQSLDTLTFSGNKGEGRIYLHRLPQSVTSVYLSRNLYAGSIDFTNLPKNLKILDVSNNSLSGLVDLRPTDQLHTLNLSYNDITEITVPVVLTRPEVDARGNPVLCVTAPICEAAVSLDPAVTLCRTVTHWMDLVFPVNTRTTSRLWECPPREPGVDCSCGASGVLHYHLTTPIPTYGNNINLAHLPATLITFAATRNGFQGTLDLSSLPQGLQHLNISYNNITAVNGTLPPNLQTLDLSHNPDLSGHIDATNQPTQPQHVNITETGPSLTIAVAPTTTVIGGGNKIINEEQEGTTIALSVVLGVSGILLVILVAVFIVLIVNFKVLPKRKARVQPRKETVSAPATPGTSVLRRDSVQLNLQDSPDTEQTTVTDFSTTRDGPGSPLVADGTANAGSLVAERIAAVAQLTDNASNGQHDTNASPSSQTNKTKDNVHNHNT